MSAMRRAAFDSLSIATATCFGGASTVVDSRHSDGAWGGGVAAVRSGACAYCILMILSLACFLSEILAI